MRAPTKIISNARHLRRTLPVPEARLWNRPIGPYVLDFYCTNAHLAAEVDGISEDMGDPQRDNRRDAWRKKHGVTVVRIPAAQLMYGIDKAADAIVRLASERL